jgi:hypothetical protein
MAFLGAMSPLLLIPAYEPFVAFVIQGATVAAGVQLARWRQARKSGESFLKSRFSLKTILLAMVPTAVLVAVWARAPEVGWEGWLSTAKIGIAAGAVVLVSLWLLRATSISWTWRISTGMAVVLGLSCAMAYFEDFVSRLVDDSSSLLTTNSGLFSDYPELIWLIILPAVSLLLLTFGVVLVRPLLSRWGIARVALAGVLLVIVATPSTGVYWQLMNPLPVPVTVLPSPNGYDDFLAAVKLLPSHPLVNSANFDPETATEQELQQASDELAAVFDQVRRGLKHPAMTSPTYTMDDIRMDDFMSFRTMARGFDAQGRWLLKSGDSGQAVDVFIDGARFGVQMAKGGVMVNDLVGLACTGVAMKGLYLSRQEIPPENITRTISVLKQLETERDLAEDFLYRDKVWSQRWGGWYSHLMVILSKVSDEDWDSAEMYAQARARELATLRLLQLELALRLYKHDQGQHPESLDELVPKYIEAVPLDPMSPTNEPLRSVQTENGLVPYSVGYNGIDDQGQADPDDPTFGDLRLDVLWRPQTAVGQQTTASLSDVEDELEFEAEPDEQD